MKQAFSIFVLAALLLTAASCGSETSAQPGNDTDPSADAVTEAETALSDLLPVTDYGGADFTILLPSQHTYEFSEAMTGDLVEDAEYNRDKTIEERYNVKLHYIAESGDWAAKDTYNGLIRQSVMAGDGSFDLVDGMIAVVNMLTPEGVFLNLLDLDGIDFSDPWWAQDIDKTLAISDRLYGICGSGLTSVYRSAYVIFYNQELINQNDLDDPAQLTIDGKWTLDRFLSMQKDFTLDLDADGKFTAADQYGYTLSGVTQRAFQTSMELPVIKRNNDGKLEFTGLTQRFSDAVDRYRAAITDQSLVWSGTGHSDPDMISMFTSDRALFAGQTIIEIEAYRSMESDFGMVPLPKFDDAQEQYHTQIATGSGMFFIPKTVKDPGMTVSILNAYNCLSYENVINVYYESALKDKYTRNERNQKVIDIINRSMTMDVTFAYGTTLGNSPNTIFADDTMSNTSTLSSRFASMETSMAASIASLEETFASHED